MEDADDRPAHAAAEDGASCQYRALPRCRDDAALADGGLRLALVGSDHEANARLQLGEAAALFSWFDCGASIFGKATKFRGVVKRAGLTPAQVISIGDEVRDIEAPRAAGIARGALAWAMPRRQNCARSGLI